MIRPGLEGGLQSAPAILAPLLLGDSRATHRCGRIHTVSLKDVQLLGMEVILLFFLIIHPQVSPKERNLQKNLWKSRRSPPRHATACKHAADGCMLSVIPTQNCQGDEKERRGEEKKKCCISKCGVSRWLKLTCRPTEHFSPEWKLVRKRGSSFVLTEGNGTPPRLLART